MNIEVKAQLALECLKVARSLVNVNTSEEVVLKIADKILKFCLQE